MIHGIFSLYTEKVNQRGRQCASWALSYCREVIISTRNKYPTSRPPLLVRSMRRSSRISDCPVHVRQVAQISPICGLNWRIWAKFIGREGGRARIEHDPDFLAIRHIRLSTRWDERRVLASRNRNVRSRRALSAAGKPTTLGIGKLSDTDFWQTDRSSRAVNLQHSGRLTARPPRLVSLNLALISSPV